MKLAGIPGCGVCEWSGVRGFLGAVLRRWRLALLALPVMWWSSCATLPEAPMRSLESEAAAVAGAVKPRNAPEAPAESRPGLATKFGDELRDPIVRRDFTRASSKPAGVDRIYYNDRDGLEAMASYRRRSGGLWQAAGGLVEWGIKSGMGHAATYASGGRRFVAGSPGRAYSIVVKNRCRSRVEVVLSVDGLDVMDGKAASFAKRGYLIEPGATLEVKGWRSGWDTVARFEFSSVGASYANLRHGDTRNVGVIGLAVFGEKGVDPWTWMPGEVERRRSATPFATAP